MGESDLFGVAAVLLELVRVYMALHRQVLRYSMVIKVKWLNFPANLILPFDSVDLFDKVTKSYFQE
ncbi:hypothetical protein GNX18_06135 [Microbulbifer sp. SH-1]|uniref:hypothetical protein n=1 Tax=Microbulbifer sp. SH-1 TaxID=2681547 RepID=UPI00140C3B36|nr:hypothetical protein GNX18_06135 [Microbulbifer sp. SH-1]